MRATTDLTHRVLRDVETERLRQFRKHGSQYHLPNGTGPDLTMFRELAQAVDSPGGLGGPATNGDLAEAAKRRCKARSQNEGGDGTITFEHILTEEFFEAMAEEDPEALRKELVQVAAVAVQWVEKLDLERRLAEEAAYGG